MNDAGLDGSRESSTLEDAGKGVLSPVHFIGRFDTTGAAGPKFSWPGSAIVARFSGTGATLRVHDSGTNFFSVSIDGAPSTMLATTSAVDDYVVAKGLSDGEHQISVTKRTESSVGTVQFLGLASTEGRPLVPTPEPFVRRIEYIGDSITCGYGVLGTGPGCAFTAATESEPEAYSGLASLALGAAHTAIAYSGIGVYRNYGGGTANVMIDRFGRALADDPTSLWDFRLVPDVVVINLGTNDFAQGDPGQAFQVAYGTLVKTVRAKYAGAFIVATISPMLGVPARNEQRTYIAAALDSLKAAGDTRLSVVEFDQQVATDGYGCDYHPSLATQKKMADKLVPAIRALTGW